MRRFSFSILLFRYVAILLVLFCVSSIQLLQAKTKNTFSDKSISSAWQMMNADEYSKCENAFKEIAVSNADKNTRKKAYLGLYSYYAMKQYYSLANDAMLKALELMDGDELHATLFAYMATPSAIKSLTNEDSDVMKLYKRIIENPDRMGILKAMCYERIGAFYESKGKFNELKKAYSSINAITNWAVIGPFDNPVGSGYTTVYPPEKELDRNKSYSGFNSAPCSWFVPPTQRFDGWIDFERFFITSDAVFYAYTFVYSPNKQQVSFRVGTSGAFKAFLNDEEILNSPDEFNNDLDTYICSTELQQGWNKVLIKCSSSEISRNNFMLRITDSKGENISGLKTATELQSYPSKPNAKTEKISNPFLAYFNNAIKSEPNSIENYLLLAQAYLRNDDGENGEVTLETALAKFPNNLVIIDNLNDAYFRNSKRDLAIASLEKLSLVEPPLPNPLIYRYNEEVRNRNIEKAEEIFAKIEKHISNPEELITYKIQLMSIKNDPSIPEYVKEQFKLYPKNVGLLSAVSALDIRTKRDYNTAINNWKSYLETNYTFDALIAIADLYYEKGEFSEWENYANKVIELANGATGYYGRMAKNFISREEYDKAETMIKRALAYCPGSGLYYEYLGDIERKRNNNASAIEYYQTSMKYNPADRDVRKTLNDMQGKKQTWSQFPNANTESIIKSAPKASDYPDDASIILLDDTKYIIHPNNGGFDVRRELVIKVMKQEGIDDWKEQRLGRYSIIEKAVTIKANGSEIRADESKGNVIFKSLQEGDCLYLRYKEYYSEPGRFQGQFVAKEYFQSSDPIVESKLSILAPNDLKFNIMVNDMPSEPETTAFDSDSKLYTWQVQNLPAVKREAGMPSLEVVGKYVEVSTIPSWSVISDWYTDMTYQRAKVTHEIRDKMNELTENGKVVNENEIIRRVYQFITDSIRYSFVPFRQSGYVPQKARDILINRIGDCKDVATLGISMLSVVGIKAQYVLVNTNTSTNHRQLPSRDFDHVILVVTTKQGALYMDLTASNYPIGSVPSGDVDAFSLLIARGNSTAGYLQRSYFKPNNIDINGVLKLSDNGDISVERTNSYSGALSAMIRSSFRSLGKDEREKIITENLSNTFPNVTLKSLIIEGIDSLSNSAQLKENFNAPNYSNDIGSFKTIKLPWKTSLELDESFSYSERKFQLEFDLGYDVSSEQLTVIFPKDLTLQEIPKNVSLTSPIADYSITYSASSNQLLAKRTFTIKKRLAETNEYQAIKTFYNNVVKSDEQQLLLGVGKSKPASPKSKK